MSCEIPLAGSIFGQTDGGILLKTGYGHPRIYVTDGVGGLPQSIRKDLNTNRPIQDTANVSFAKHFDLMKPDGPTSICGFKKMKTFIHKYRILPVRP